MNKINIEGAPIHQTDIETLWTYEDLAKILRRSENTLRRDVMCRRIPFIRVGRSIRFSPVEIKAYIESNKVNIRKHI